MSDDIGAYALEPRWVRRSFDRAAKTYDAAAVLHTEVRENLLQRLQLTKLVPRVVLDAGAGTGHASRALKRSYPKALVVALDSSHKMLQEAKRQQSWLRSFERVCADAELLPLGEGSIDLIVSNLMLQWCNPDAVFAEFRRVLAPHGLLSFSAFGPDTLRELRAAWQQVDSHSHACR
jgi:malonyl-CoA O-methyltransferase